MSQRFNNNDREIENIILQSYKIVRDEYWSSMWVKLW